MWKKGCPRPKVWLWVYGNELRAVFKNIVLAEYYCRYDVRDHKVKDIRDGRYFPHDDFASDQYTLIPSRLTKPWWSIASRRRRGQVRLPFPAQPLWLFELVS